MGEQQATEAAPARRAGEGRPDAIGRLIAAAPADQPVTLALVALTRFDIVNAAFGRAAGDALLAAVGRRIATLGEGAAVARGDGATFGVVLPRAAAEAERLLGAIDSGLARPFPVDSQEANLGVRIGAAHRSAGESAAILWRRATDALQAAGRGDGARLRFADPAAPAPAHNLAADLHRAIDRREIDILFQPQVALADGRIGGVEALARWEHPRHGVLGAEPLFAAAERADLGLALSDHIQSVALARAAAWPAALAELRIALNVTAADLARPDFADRFLARVAASGIAPARVTAEVTESGFISEIDAVSDRLGRLRDAGVRVAIDDFGTGYSSLAYLKSLPLDYLKIDRSLTVDIAGSARDGVIVRGVIGIAHGLGLRTIAEGVETEAQRALLAAEGCDFLQGFLCAGPLDDAALAKLVGDAA